MDFSLEQSEKNLITAHDANGIDINGSRYTQPLLLSPDQIETNWQAIDFSQPDLSLVETIKKLKPEVVLIASGQKHLPLPSQLHRAFISVDLSAECMSLSAACRTYNVLCNELRRVVVSIQFE